MEQELQLQKQLTCVTMEKLKVTDGQGDLRPLEETMVQRALDQVQKERAELEAETTDLEAVAMRRQKEMVQEALRLERDMAEVVKHREIVILEYEAGRLKDLVQNRADSLGGGIVGIEAVARGRQGGDTPVKGLVFGDVEKNGLIPRRAVKNEAPSLGILNPMAVEVCLEGDMMQGGKVNPALKQPTGPTDTGREKPAGGPEIEEKGGDDGKVGAANRSMVVDLTNNSTFDVYNSDEDNSQLEPPHIPQEQLKKELQSGEVESSRPSLSQDLCKEVNIMGEIEDGLNNKEVLAQQEEILAQIRRENEAAVRTKELVAKLALSSEGEDNSEQVAVTEKQVVKQNEERPIGTDLSEFIVVAVKKRQMKMARKSEESASERKLEMRKSGGDDDVRSPPKNEETMAELEAERKKARELIRQRTAAKENEIHPVPKRYEGASRANGEAKKKGMVAEKKKQLSVASSSKFKPSWEKRPELVGPSQGGGGRSSTSRSCGK